MSRTISIISVKGGVGKTTLVANLAYILANDFNKKVLVVDTNINAPNLGLHLGIVNPEHTLQNILKDQIMAKDAIYEHKWGFSFLAASTQKEKKINMSKLKLKLQGLKNTYDAIILDTTPTIEPELHAALEASDEALIVASPDYFTLSSTLKTIKLAKEKNTLIRGMVLNKVRNKHFEVRSREIEKLAKIPALAQIPYNKNFQKALSEILPYTAMYPNSLASLNLKKLAASLVDEKYKEPNIFKRLTARIKND